VHDIFRAKTTYAPTLAQLSVFNKVREKKHANSLKLTLIQASHIKFQSTTKATQSTNSKFYFMSRTEV
jgi:hypothetical protein